MPASLEEQVGVRKGDDGDPRFGDLASYRDLDVGFLHAQSHAVASRYRMFESGLDHLPGQVTQCEYRWVKHLVDVQVEAHPGLGRNG